MSQKSNTMKIVGATVEPIKIPAAYLEVFANGTFYVIGRPTGGHNCDRMGCSSIEHTIAKGRLPDWQVEDILGIEHEHLNEIGD